MGAWLRSTPEKLERPGNRDEGQDEKLNKRKFNVHPSAGMVLNTRLSDLKSGPFPNLAVFVLVSAIGLGGSGYQAE